MKIETEIIIYKITNLINNKSYIGKTKVFHTRIKNHINNVHNSLIGQAIQEFGHENFSAEKIEITTSDSNASNLEKHYIKLYNTIYPNGYNVQGTNGETSKIAIKKIVLNRNKNNPLGYTGIYYNKDNKTYYTKFKTKDKHISKQFKSMIKAAEFYDLSMMFLYGNDCIVNFPEKLNKYLKEIKEINFKEIFEKETSSKFIGVCWKYNCNKWNSYYSSMNNEKRLTQYTIGFFKNERKAAFMRDIYVIVNKINSKLNFPNIITKFSKEKILNYYNNNEFKNSPLNKGVFFRKEDNRWVANLLLKNKKIYVGRFLNKDIAKIKLKEFAEKNNLFIFKLLEDYYSN